MQKVFSARLDESVLDDMERVTRTLKITKRRFLEDAIRRQAMALGGQRGSDVWAETSGAWRRREDPKATIRKARAAFRTAFARRSR